MLRRRVIRGGFLLGLRSAAGVALTFVGGVLLARLLAPSSFGEYALVSFWCVLLSHLAEGGLGTYLVRLPEPPTPQEISTAFSMIHTASLLAAVFAAGLVGPAFAFWFQEPRLLPAFALGAAAVYVTAWGAVPFSLMLHDLDYGRVGAITLASMAAHYVTAVALAAAGFGLFALVLGELAKSATQALLANLARPVSLAGARSPEAARAMWRYGSAFWTASLAANLNDALGSIAVARLAGLEAAGYVRQAYGALHQARLPHTVVFDVSLPALAKVQHDHPRLRRVVGEALAYQVPLVALPVFSVAALAEWLIPWLLGERWRPAASLVLLGALPVTALSFFSLHSAAFFAAGDSPLVSRFQLLYAGALWPVALLAIRWLGPAGLPVAQMVCLPVFWVLHRSFERRFGPLPLGRIALALALLGGAALAAHLSGSLPLALVAVAVMAAIALGLDPRTRGMLRHAVDGLRSPGGAGS
jgi:PST family polysaccharide transporter